MASGTIFVVFVLSFVARFEHGLTNEGTPAPQDVQDVTLVLVYGKNQAYGLGKAVRERYGSLLPEQFSHKDIKAHSSSAERCQMTMQTFLNGLYPPVGDSVWNPQIQWQPIPVAINNPLLRMYSVKDCKTSDDGWAPIDDDSLPELRNWLYTDSAVIEYVTQNEGVEASLSNMADIADNLHNLHILHLSYPDWLEYPSISGYTKESLYEKIMSFAEAHQIACAKYGPCRRIMGGTWAEHITETLKEKRDGKTEQLKIVPYASERHIFLGKMVPGASCREGWCDINTFLNGMEPKTIEDWETACRIPGKTCPAQASPAQTAGSGSSNSCATEKDTSAASSCDQWARRGMCQSNEGVRYLFCRYTCGCRYNSAG